MSVATPRYVQEAVHTVCYVDEDSALQGATPRRPQQREGEL